MGRLVRWVQTLEHLLNTSQMKEGRKKGRKGGREGGREEKICISKLREKIGAG